MKKKLCIIGCGGFARETLCYFIELNGNDHNNLNNLVCFMEKDENFHTENIMGIDVIRQSEFNPDSYDVVIAIANPETRKDIVNSLPKTTTYTNIINPNAHISKWVDFGLNTIIAPNVVITCNIKLGSHTQLNWNTTIGHDCTIGDFFTTAPGVHISGNCNIGDCVYFGTNASIREKCTITDNVTIGMGAVVLNNINEPGVYVGNPLRKIK
jgi:sugar O-acyltransferase (sialic acid O-acetyltransferase NeuD family)